MAAHALAASTAQRPHADPHQYDDEAPDDMAAHLRLAGRADLALALEAYRLRRLSLAQAIGASGTSATGFLSAARTAGVLPCFTGAVHDPIVGRAG